MSPVTLNPDEDQPNAGEKLEDHPFGTGPHENEQPERRDQLPTIPYNRPALRDVVEDCLKAARIANCF